MKTSLAVTLLSFSLTLSTVAAAQSTPAAIQRLSISAFGGATGTFTGLNASRNAAITAGVDLSFRPFHGYYPSAEIRGTFPVDNGGIVGERNFLAGVKVERYFGVLHPYGDVLFGRNRMDYQQGGYPNADGTLLYLQSFGNLIAIGGGLDVDMSPHFALKLDGQFQRYQTPVTASGDVYSKAGTIGVVYRFNFNHQFHYDRRTGQVTNLPKEPAPRAVPPPAPPAVDATPADATAPDATMSAAPDAAVPAAPTDAAPPPAPATDPSATPSAPPPAPAAPSAPAPAATPPNPPTPQPQQPQ